MDVGSSSVGLLPEEILYNVGYADDIILLSDDTQVMQSTLNQLAVSVDIVEAGEDYANLGHL